MQDSKSNNRLFLFSGLIIVVTLIAIVSFFAEGNNYIFLDGGSSTSNISSDYVPYTNATSNLDLGDNNLYTAKVGIGTTSPTEVLDVVGNINIPVNNAYTYDGYNALRLATKGDSIEQTSVIIGKEAGDNITDGTTIRQTVIGNRAGILNEGDMQTAIGYQSGTANIGSEQLAVGTKSGYFNEGDEQLAIGSRSGRENTGNKQTALGTYSGYRNTGESQTAIGYNAGYENTGGQQTAIGYYAGQLNTADKQTALGYYAGRLNTQTGQTAIGYSAGYGNTGSGQMALGYYAGRENSGIEQTAVGFYAGFQNTGNRQMALGYQAGRENSGDDQVAIGFFAGKENIMGKQTVIGYQAGNVNTGDKQTGMGYYAGRSNSGHDQIAMGFFSGYGNSGDEVIGIGYGATRDNQGDDVVAIGYQAGKNNVDNNKFILKQSNVNDDPLIEGNFQDGSVAFGSNNITGLGDGDINVSNIYYDTLTAKSPIFKGTAHSNWKEVEFPEYISQDWKLGIKVDEEWNIEQVYFKYPSKNINKFYNPTEFNNQVCDYNTVTKDMCNQIINKTTRLHNKQECINNNYNWDGNCYEIVKIETTYENAVETKPVYNTTTENYECTKLNEQLEEYTTTCTNIITTSEIISYQHNFKKECDWEEETGYYCTERNEIII